MNSERLPIAGCAESDAGRHAGTAAAYCELWTRLQGGQAQCPLAQHGSEPQLSLRWQRGPGGGRCVMAGEWQADSPGQS